MATIDELIASTEVELEAAIKRRDKNIAEGKAILALARQEGRSATTEEEDARLQELTDARPAVKAEIKSIQRKLEEAHRIKAEEAEAVREAAEVQPTRAATRAQTAQASRGEQRVQPGREERVYRPDFDRRGAQFLRDIVDNFLYQDVRANDRLARHMQEERVERAQYLQRDVGTGAFAGLTVPQYLTEMYAPATAALRPFADVCNKHELPANGMTVNISRITTATGVALQATENSGVQETDIDDTLLTENVQTAAGSQDISRQALERGTGVDDVVMDDLFRRYASTLDSTLINQATTGLTNVAQSNTYDDSTPTAAELYPKILGAASGSEAALLGFAAPNYAIMHSRRWYWLSSQLTSTWPFISQPQIPPQTAGTNFAVGYNKGVRGVLPNGLAVVVDNNIATNLGTATSQDEIYVVAAEECHLWEDPQAPVFIRAEQPLVQNLAVRLVLYGYFAYSLRRYTNGTQKIAGTGLATPSF